MDCLYMTYYMCRLADDRGKTILHNQCFVRFCNDFTKENGRVVEKLLSYEKLKSKLNIIDKINRLPVIQRNNKRCLIYGYCDITNYLAKLNANRYANDSKKRIMLKALKRFNILGGAVRIGNKIYVKKHPIDYNAIK